MRGLRCLLGFHDFYAVYTPLILSQKNLPSNAVELFKEQKQYVTMKRICVRPDCKKKQEYIIQLSGKLQDWDVLLSAPNFLSEEWNDAQP